MCVLRCRQGFAQWYRREEGEKVTAPQVGSGIGDADDSARAVMGAELSDVPDPAPTTVAVALHGAPVTAQARIAFYSSDEWEQFILEWAKGLKPGYVQVKRFGGTGDKGADVAAFKSDQGLDGHWDCFQGKHYAEPLNLSDAAPEMLKVFLAVVEGVYVMPDTYSFLAPKGCGTTLNRLLSQPTRLKDQFISRLATGQALAARTDPDRLSAIRELAEATDFGMFKSIELIDALEVHRTTPYYSARFATSLNARPAHQPPPSTVGPHETRYVDQLLQVYAEKHPEESLKTETLAGNLKVGQHFQRQRETFYKAESLRVYARDSVPPGTFDKLQDDVRSGVIDIAEAEHPNGYVRLASVLSQVGQLDLSRHTLIAVSDIDDRKGICHQLANVDRLTWMPTP